MSLALSRILAFFVRDWKSETSYRFAFFLQFTGLGWMLVLFALVARMIPHDLPMLQKYGGDWFTFVVLGYAPLEYLRVGVLGFSSRLREAQTLGTLEALLVTRADMPTIIFGSVAYPYALATLRAGLLITVARLFAPAPHPLALPGLVGIMALSFVVFGSLGILSASFVMVFKKADPVSLVLMGVSMLLSGLLFPTEVLGAAEPISRVLPLTHAVEGVRRAALGGSLGSVASEAAWLAGFAVVLVPLAFLSFRYALHLARRDGTLAQY